MSPLSILVLADSDPAHAQTVLDHIFSFGRYSHHTISYANPVGVREAALQLERYDVVVVHWSLVITYDTYISPTIRERIRAFDGLKIQFIQDEYRWVNEITTMMRWLGIDVIYSVAGLTESKKLYSGRVDAEIIQTFTGLVPDELEGAESPTLEERAIHIGYRGRELPFWTGARAHEKVAIGAGVLARAHEFGLRCDIAWTEDARIYREDWVKFISSCRATLGTSSGASIADYDGAAEAAVRTYLATHPLASFDHVAADVIGQWEGNIDIDVVSPRIFEAAALRTALILFPGKYSGILKPWRHYIPLERDFSNLREIAAIVKDPGRLQPYVEAAYDDLVRSGRYSLRAFVAEFDAEVERAYTSRGLARRMPKLVQQPSRLVRLFRR